MIVVYLVSSSDVNLHDQIPVLILHVLEADIAQDSGVVDEDMDPAEALDCGLDDGLSVLDTVVVGDCLSASILDLLDDIVSSL